MLAEYDATALGHAATPNPKLNDESSCTGFPAMRSEAAQLLAP